MRSRKLVQICQAVSLQHEKLQRFRFYDVNVTAHTGGCVTDQPKFELFDIANVVRSSSGSSSVHLSLCFCSCPVGNCLIRCVGGSTSENSEKRGGWSSDSGMFLSNRKFSSEPLSPKSLKILVKSFDLMLPVAGGGDLIPFNH